MATDVYEMSFGNVLKSDSDEGCTIVYLHFMVLEICYYKNVVLCVCVCVCVYENSKSSNALNVFLGTPFSLKKDLMKLATKIEL